MGLNDGPLDVADGGAEDGVLVPGGDAGLGDAGFLDDLLMGDAAGEHFGHGSLLVGEGVLPDELFTFLEDDLAIHRCLPRVKR